MGKYVCCKTDTNNHQFEAENWKVDNEGIKKPLSQQRKEKSPKIDNEKSEYLLMV